MTSSAHEDWDECLSEIPFIATRTPGYFKKQDGDQPVKREVNLEWVNDNFRVFTIFWHDNMSVTCENLYTTMDYGTQPCTRAITALREIFSHRSGAMTLWIREEKDPFQYAFVDLRDTFDEEYKLGNPFRRFYNTKTTPETQMVYIDSDFRGNGAIVAPAKRPRMHTRPQSVHPDILEFTTRIGVGVLQCMEFEQQLVDQVNATAAYLKLIKCPVGGDRVYKGSLLLQPYIQKKLAKGDIVYLNFRPNSPRAHEEWRSEVVAPFAWTPSGEISLDVYRPRLPHSQVLELLVVGDTEAYISLEISSSEMPNLPSCVYIEDLRPTMLSIIKQFNIMLRIQITTIFL
jgi:hypothetical protein